MKLVALGVVLFMLAWGWATWMFSDSPQDPTDL